jgi:hypothetical protein
MYKRERKDASRIVTRLQRTANAHILEMLALAVRIVTCATHGLKSAERFVRIYLVTVSEG